MKENFTISKLQEVIRKFRLKIKNEPTGIYWCNLNFQLISIEQNTKKTFILVDDEYGDVKASADLILLNLLIYEYQDFVEAENYLVWCKEKELDAESNEARAHYFNLEVKASFLNELLEGLEPISPMEWELKSDEAQALRNVKY